MFTLDVEETGRKPGMALRTVSVAMRKMKDSGVPWIGEIPDDWSVGKIKFFFSITLGKMLTPQPSSTTDTLEEYLCAQNITENGLQLDTIKQMWLSEEEKKSLKLQKCDILVV